MKVVKRLLDFLVFFYYITGVGKLMKGGWSKSSRLLQRDRHCYGVQRLLVGRGLQANTNKRG